MTTRHDPREERRAARNLARRALLDLARTAGAQTTTRPAFRGSHTAVPDIEPLAGLAASRALELAARDHGAGYVRAAREAGHSWQDIGTALGLVPGGDAHQAGETVAEAAFTYAAGSPGTEMACRYGRSVAWTCGSCDQVIFDRGLCNGPAEDERGHARNCPRLAATIAAWDAAWDALDADWSLPMGDLRGNCARWLAGATRFSARRGGHDRHPPGAPASSRRRPHSRARFARHM